MIGYCIASAYANEGANLGITKWRDMIEYVGFDDAVKLRNGPQWREDGTYKEKLESGPIFIPWYMEWVKLLNQ